VLIENIAAATIDHEGRLTFHATNREERIRVSVSGLD
jgi:hypothetical protein